MAARARPLSVAACVLAAQASGPACATAFAGIGEDHACAITLARTVQCAGSNTSGQLGRGVIDAGSATPVDVAGVGNVSMLAGGFFHTCALSQAGGVRCWGSDTSGQLGDGVVGPDRGDAQDVVGLTSGVIQIAAGEFHTCALTQAGAVLCWGSDGQGQLGDGTSGAGTATPQAVVGLGSGVAMIAAGQYHTCAVLSASGGVKCWGDNTYGAIGDTPIGVGQRRPTPTDVSTLTSGVAAVTAGAGHSCALTIAGGVKCWGSDDDYGELGDGVIGPDRAAPADVITLTSGVASIHAGGGPSTCAVTTTGGLRCWGNDAYGQLGDAAVLPGASRPTPFPVDGLHSGVLAAAVGYWDACALTSGGRVRCWGRNSMGQLADGTTISASPFGRSTPGDALFATYSSGGALADLVSSLSNPSPAASERMGAAVAVADSVLVVAVPGANGGAGEVLVYDLDPLTGGFDLPQRAEAKRGALPAPSARLQAAGLDKGAGFALAVAISRNGGLIGVGAPGANSGVGQVLVYRRTGASWNDTLPAPTATLAPTPTAGVTPAGFGSAIAIDGNGNIAVGAPGSDVGANADAGSSYAFRDSGAAIDPNGTALTAATVQALSRFGSAVAVDAGTIVIGAPMQDGAETDLGGAYAFPPATPGGGGGFNLAIALTCLGGGNVGGGAHACGTSVGIRGDTIVAGAPGADSAGIDAGGAEVFVVDGSTYERAAMLLPAAGAGQQAGSAVALNRHAVLLGAPDAGAAQPEQGRGYVYAIPPVWTATAQPSATLGCDCDDSGKRGTAVAASDRYFALGAPDADIAGVIAAGRTDAFLFGVVHRNGFE